MLSLTDSVPSRVIIEGVTPEVDAGRFTAKRTVGEQLIIGADIYCDGHEVLASLVRYRPPNEENWIEVPLQPLVNDRWTGAFELTRQGWYEYTLHAWIDRFATWRRDLLKKIAAAQDVKSELLEGAEFVQETSQRATGPDGEWLRNQAQTMMRAEGAASVAAATDEILLTLMQRHAERTFGAQYERVLRLWVERERARYGAWYELFPRSCADEPGKHGAFRDVEKRLSYIAEMGFDVLYLPPIHPIGRSFRKGPNNTLTAGPEDPGSPWAIGSEEGGHKAIHSQLGTFDDFHHLLDAARQQGIEIALDIAYQCSPDHPYVKEHPEWFRHRPDGTIKYAENPPKKYQDIYPLDFECADWKNLWQELLDVVLYWAQHDVRIFRIDNPHTKPFRFWEWLIANVQQQYPDAIFLSEAFTRPKVMKYLAKSGFTQSYSYFTWRNTKHEITEYFSELTQSPVGDYMRPNLFANTPDILPEYLQHGGRAGYQIRLILAATLGATYGIYGPPFEVFESTPRPQSEEYLDSEKYQLRHWDWNRPNVFREFIALVNRIRRENPALQFNQRLQFFRSDNDEILFFGKTTPDMSNIIMVMVNLDPNYVQSGYVHVPLEEFGLLESDGYQVQDLLTGAHFLWHGRSNYVALDPQITAAHVLRLRKKTRTERDFDYFM